MTLFVHLHCSDSVIMLLHIPPPRQLLKCWFYPSVTDFSVLSFVWGFFYTNKRGQSAHSNHYSVFHGKMCSRFVMKSGFYCAHRSSSDFSQHVSKRRLIFQVNNIITIMMWWNSSVRPSNTLCFDIFIWWEIVSPNPRLELCLLSVVYNCLTHF